MATEVSQSRFPALLRDESPSSSASGTDIDYEFDELQCLFCNQMSSDLDENMVHMSKAHGLYVDLTNLLVDLETLLAHFHFVISERYECLYCRTQRNTRQAVQQHMMAKGHCKYDLTDEDAELREFYDFPSSLTLQEQHQKLAAMRSSDNPQLLSQARSRKSRSSQHADQNDSHITAALSRQESPTPVAQPNNETETPSHTRTELSTRALKQECTLNNQLAQLRAEDRRSLSHLPASQQRALLATHHKQAEKARRTEQTHQSNLERAGNKVNCLDKIRLIRKPPHTGNVFSLNR